MKKTRQYLQISFGVLLLSMGYYFFYLPTGLVSGGTNGIGIIVQNYIPFSISIFILIINVVLLFIGLFLLGKEFFYKTAYSSILFPAIIFVFERIFDENFFFRSEVNVPYFIAALVGGTLTAVGLGICFLNNGTTGGMDVVQKIISKYLHIPYSIAMYMTDVLIIFIGALVFKGGFGFKIEQAVFGILTVIYVGYIVDTIALNAKTRRTAYIITTKPIEMKELIYKIVGRGVTECDVRGGFKNENKIMLICTLNKSESYKLNSYISTVDTEAFAFMTQTKEVAGNYDK